MKIDPALVTISERDTPHGPLFDVSYNGVLLDRHAMRCDPMSEQEFWRSVASDRLQHWLDGASAHDRLEFFRKTQAQP